MKSRIAHAALVLLVALIGVSIGRYTAPTRIEERERVVTKTVEVAAKQKDESRVEAESTSERTATRWTVHEVHHRDGTMERTASAETGRSSETAARTAEAKRETEVRYVDKFIDRESIKIVEAKAATWSIGARAGVLGGSRAVYGAEASRRIIGPLWAGIYATTAKEAGVAIRWEF